MAVVMEKLGFIVAYCLDYSVLCQKFTYPLLNYKNMITHFEKVKNFLEELEFHLQSEDAEEELVVVTDEDKGISHLMIDCEGEVLLLEQYIFQLKDPNDSAVLRRLLEINLNIVHGALALADDNRVIFRDTLQLENLDRNELESSINSVGLMMAEHAEEFIRFAKI